jgi:hypothetical protein
MASTSDSFSSLLSVKLGSVAISAKPVGSSPLLAIVSLLSPLPLSLLLSELSLALLRVLSAAGPLSPDVMVPPPLVPAGIHEEVDLESLFELIEHDQPELKLLLSLTKHLDDSSRINFELM